MRAALWLGTLAITCLCVLIFQQQHPVEDISVACDATFLAQATSQCQSTQFHLPGFSTEIRHNAIHATGNAAFTMKALMLWDDEQDPPTSVAPPPHVQAARGLLKHLQQSGLNAWYDGCGGFQRIQWGPKCAAAYVDSSAFISMVLFFGDKFKSTDFLRWFHGDVNPRAADYYGTAIGHPKGWTHVKFVEAITVGDFLFVKYKNGGKVSGHCMMINHDIRTAEPPHVPYPDGMYAYDVNVIDAAEKPHGPKDTRQLHPGKWGSNGVGSGNIRLFVNSDTTLAGYAWDTSPSAPIHWVQDYPAVIARVDTVYSPDFHLAGDE